MTDGTSFSEYRADQGAGVDRICNDPNRLLKKEGTRMIELKHNEQVSIRTLYLLKNSTAKLARQSLDWAKDTWRGWVVSCWTSELQTHALIPLVQIRVVMEECLQS